MDIGVWMTSQTLSAKLDEADLGHPEAAWNMARWPKGFSSDPKVPNRLFVACGGQWLGYFIISREMLYLPEDKRTPYVLLFDTRSWTALPDGLDRKRFRGFTYNVPVEVDGEWKLSEDG